MDLGALIERAWERRLELHRQEDLDCYRLFHGFAEGCPGLDIDRYGAAVLIHHAAALEGALPAIVAALDGCRRFDLIFARGRGREGEVGWREPWAVRGAMPRAPLEVREHGLRFLIEPWRAGNPGLYLDARPARRWIRDHSEGRRVLNLFAFTGSLGLAAASGGARRVVHVDSQKGALALCADNHALSGAAIDGRDLVRVNVYQHLRRAQAGRQRFGAVILDPPPGPEAPRRKDRTPGRRGIAALVPLVARMLEPGGWLLCFFHRGERGRDQREEEVLAAAGLPLEVAWRGESGPDFPAARERDKLRLTAFARPGCA